MAIPAVEIQQFAANWQANTASPGFGSFTVTPDASSDLPHLARNLEIFSAGTLSFIGLDGETDTRTYTSSMSFPQVLRVAVVRVNSWTGTAGDVKAIR